jgi:hypothetical protein
VPWKSFIYFFLSYCSVAKVINISDFSKFISKKTRKAPCGAEAFQLERKETEFNFEHEKHERHEFYNFAASTRGAF